MVRPNATARSATWRAEGAAGRIRSNGDVTEKNLPPSGGGSRRGDGPGRWLRGGHARTSPLPSCPQREHLVERRTALPRKLRSGPGAPPGRLVAGQGDLRRENGRGVRRATVARQLAEAGGDLPALERVATAQLDVPLERRRAPLVGIDVLGRALAQIQHDRRELLDGAAQVGGRDDAGVRPCPR